MTTSTTTLGRPIVLVPACHRPLGDHPFYIAGKKYIDAVVLAGAQALVVPDAEVSEIDALLDLADGVLLTGSPSNVHPRHFGEAVLDSNLPLDEERDALTLPLVSKVLARGIPLLAICRGAQETNVAMGGSLHQAVHALGPYQDHRGQDGQGAEVQYGPAHPIHVEHGGQLARILGANHAMVNSVHGQAVHQLAPGLVVEARSPDGIIEAFSKPDAPGFNLCVQWHPEWKAASNPVSMRLLQAFGDAVRQRQRTRVAHQRLPAHAPA